MLFKHCYYVADPLVYLLVQVTYLSQLLQCRTLTLHPPSSCPQSHSPPLLHLSPTAQSNFTRLLSGY